MRAPLLQALPQARSSLHPFEGWFLNVRGLFPAGEGAGYAGGIYSAAIDGIEIAEAAHPVPDAAGASAAQRMLTLVENLSADDLDGHGCVSIATRYDAWPAGGPPPPHGPI